MTEISFPFFRNVFR